MPKGNSVLTQQVASPAPGSVWNRDLVARGGMTGMLGDVRCLERTEGFLHDETDDSEINV